MIWVVYSGWTGCTAEAVFIEAETPQEAQEQARVVYEAKRPGARCSLSYEPLRLGEITECDGW